MTDVVFLIIGCVIGGLIGYNFYLIDSLKKKLLEKSKPEAKSGVTLGSYRPPTQNNTSSAVVTPKSPQLMEWEANQKTASENLVDMSIKPR